MTLTGFDEFWYILLWPELSYRLLFTLHNASEVAGGHESLNKYQQTHKTVSN